MKIAINIDSQQKGFLISLGVALARRGHQVVVWARDKDVARLVERIAPELAPGMSVLAGRTAGPDPAQAVQLSLEREERFGSTMAMLISHDRALGKGYIFNADRHPDIKRSWWGHERKLADALGQIMAWESILDQDRPDVVIALNHLHNLSLVAKSRGIPYYSIHPVRFGSRLMWSDDDYMTSTALLADIRRYLERPEPNDQWRHYAQDALSQHAHQQIGYSWAVGLRRALSVAYRDTKALLRGRLKKDSYSYLGWLPSCLRKPWSWDFFSRHGKRPADLAGYRTVYFPLQMEPEISILSLSPEFNNSMEMIAWVSKCLPADTLLVVKEQPMSYGIRSRGYYENFLKMGNVVLAKPEVSSWEWIKSSSFTATITGTAAVEAVYFQKPVLCFGKHHMVNGLPTVRHVDSFGAVRAAVPELFALGRDAAALEASAQALCNAQLGNSFELPAFKALYASSDLHLEDAEIACDNLYASAPQVFGAAGQGGRA